MKAGAGQMHEGRRVQLRTVEPSDLDYLYRLSTSPGLSYRWRYRGSTPSPEEFRDQLFSGVLAQLVVARKDSTQQPLATTILYRADLANGHAYFALLSDGAQASSLVIEGCLLFLRYVFATWPFRKLYAEVPGFNLTQFQSAIGSYLKEEAVLEEHDYHDGAYWPLYILSLSRSTWEQFKPRIDEILG